MAGRRSESKPREIHFRFGAGGNSGNGLHDIKSVNASTTSNTGNASGCIRSTGANDGGADCFGLQQKPTCNRYVECRDGMEPAGQLHCRLGVGSKQLYEHGNHHPNELSGVRINGWERGVLCCQNGRLDRTAKSLVAMVSLPRPEIEQSTRARAYSMRLCPKHQTPLTACRRTNRRNGAGIQTRCKLCCNEAQLARRRKEKPRKAPKPIRQNRLTKRLTDWYVRVLLSRGTKNVPYKAWPQWLIELKRAQMRLKRELWKQAELQ